MTAMTKLDRLANLLAGGMQPSIAALTVNVSPSYVSQLLADEDFKATLLELKESFNQQLLDPSATHTKEKETEYYMDSLAGAEQLILSKLVERVNSGLMEDRTLLASLREIGLRRDSLEKNALLKKGLAGAGLPNGENASIRVIELSIPTSCIPNMALGANNEIISIDGRSTVPMSINTLQKIVEGESREVIEHDSYDG